MVLENKFTFFFVFKFPRENERRVKGDKIRTLLPCACVQIYRNLPISPYFNGGMRVETHANFVKFLHPQVTASFGLGTYISSKVEF